MLKRLFAYSVLSTMVALGISANANAEQIVTSGDIAPTAAAAPYWTKTRMLNAKAFPLIKLSGTPSPIGTLPDQGAGQTPSFNRGGAKGQSFLASGNETIAAAISGAVQPTGYAYPPPHTTFYVLTSLYTSYPYSTVGRVFFSQGPFNYSCSGAAVGNRAVFTAGHCVSNGAGSWNRNWTFVPAYQNGSAPYGTWSAFTLGSFSSWHTLGSFCRDVGYAAVSDINGVTLANTVGWLGFAWNYSVVQHWNMFGYPAEAPYNGMWLTETQASYSRSDNPGCSPYTVGIGTTQTGGCSGGPRILSFVPGTTSGGANNYINGVNSYIYTVQPNELFSPYFDTSVKNLKDQAVLK
ncbi:MAG: hypothetical protein HY893_08045 [Deltaproteobacteria bacterium]|nr:hypothetical protein [Deltaproteobacteria bacterium]